MKRLALVDCNNFYVSCERVFRPDLIGKPVAVLSNNDGCIVARSQEVKDLGIKMGVPLFQVMPLVKRHKIHLFSSNYTLYANMSARVMALLERFAPEVEVYSIDEAFLDLSDIYSHDPCAYAQQIRQNVLQHTGIPVCVGIGPTKTLAKLGNFAAKKFPQTGGVVDLSERQRRERLFKIVPIKEVWGVGPRLAQRLNNMNIYNVWDLAQQAPHTLQNLFSVMLSRTVMELNGISCIALETETPDKQQIVCSRSFSKKLTQKQELAQALAEYGSRATEKLRQQHSVAGHVSIFLRTNLFNPNEPQYQRACGYTLPAATQDTRIILKTAHHLLNTIYKAGFAYQKCGVQLGLIQPAQHPEQFDLFEFESQSTQQAALMQVMDQVNQRFPKSLSIAASGFDKSWLAKVDNRSPHYTTDWRELVKVKCG